MFVVHPSWNEKKETIVVKVLVECPIRIETEYINLMIGEGCPEMHTNTVSFLCLSPHEYFSS